MRNNNTLTVPSFFWENFLKESIADTPEIAQHQRAADEARNHIERTNERIRDIRNNPTATDPQKAVQIERLAKKAKKQFEDIVNRHTAAISQEIIELQGEINKTISEADRLAAIETREKLDRMSSQERLAFIRRLQKSGDWDSLSHVLGRSAAFLGIEDSDLEAARQAYAMGRHPEEAKKLGTLKKVDQNLRKGFFAVVDDFDNFNSPDTQKAEAAEKALIG